MADVNPPRFFLPKVQFERLDVRDGAACRELIGRCAPDTLVHLAFILNPIHDEGLMYEVDVNGTSNVLEAAAEAGTAARARHLVHHRLRRLARQPACRSPRTGRCAACPTTPTRATRPSPIACASCGTCDTPSAR